MNRPTPIPINPRHTEMSEYWYSRYVETMARVDVSPSLKTRMAYLELANHYMAMHRLCSHSRWSMDYRAAA